jgi:hypothetical protein
MSLQKYQDELSLRAFLNQFQKTALGNVYYKSSLGGQSRVLSEKEVEDFGVRYLLLMKRNRRWSTTAAKAMMLCLPIAAIFGYFGSFLISSAVLVLGISTFFGTRLIEFVSPMILERNVWQTLEGRLSPAILSRAERIKKGFAWPLWKKILLYFVGYPLVGLLMLHRAGPHGLVAFLGPDLANKYDTGISMFMIAVFLVCLPLIPYAYWKERSKMREKISKN